MYKRKEDRCGRGPYVSRPGAPGVVGVRLGVGILGGSLAGVAFVAVTSWFATTNGQPALAPFMAIATLVQGPGAIAARTAQVWVGMVVHVVLSALFGVAFAMLTHPARANNAALAMAGLIYGGALYAVNSESSPASYHSSPPCPW